MRQLHDEVIIELIVVEIVIYGGHNARIQATVGEIFQIDASWAEKLMKTRVSKILSPTLISKILWIMRLPEGDNQIYLYIRL